MNQSELLAGKQIAQRAEYLKLQRPFQRSRPVLFRNVGQLTYDFRKYWRAWILRESMLHKRKLRLLLLWRPANCVLSVPFSSQ